MTDIRILVVDDEEDLCEILQFNLESEGYVVDVAYSAEEALQQKLEDYNLLLLDVMMGETSGFKLARILHKNPTTQNIPIIFITAKDGENDILTGFGLGAEDYIAKPFNIRELQARVKAVLRRTTQQDTKKELLRFDKLTLHTGAKKVTLNNEEIPCTKKEYEMLKLFLQFPNRVFTREEILQKVWPDDVYVLDRTIDVNINRLRKKIEPYGKNIVTRLGYGYVFEP